MHRSRVGVLLIDHPTTTYDAAATFWQGATGSAAGSRPHDDDPYASLAPLPGDVRFELQRTGEGTAPRIHLDIESDDVEAEIARVLALGAALVRREERYAVLRDPGGVLFCVVPAWTDGFEEHATTWE